MWLENNKKLKRRKKNITVKKKERKKETPYMTGPGRSWNSSRGS